MPFSRRAIHHVAALMAITGLPGQRSASSARRTIERLVPHWTMASMSGPSTARMAGRSSSSVTWAIDGGGALEALDGRHLEADLAEEADHVGVADRLVGVTTPIRFAP